MHSKSTQALIPSHSRSWTKQLSVFYLILIIIICGSCYLSCSTHVIAHAITWFVVRLEEPFRWLPVARYSAVGRKFLVRFRELTSRVRGKRQMNWIAFVLFHIWNGIRRFRIRRKRKTHTLPNVYMFILQCSPSAVFSVLWIARTVFGHSQPLTWSGF